MTDQIRELLPSDVITHDKSKEIVVQRTILNAMYEQYLASLPEEPRSYISFQEWVLRETHAIDYRWSKDMCTAIITFKSEKDYTWSLLKKFPIYAPCNTNYFV